MRKFISLLFISFYLKLEDKMCAQFDDDDDGEDFDDVSFSREDDDSEEY